MVDVQSYPALLMMDIESRRCSVSCTKEARPELQNRLLKSSADAIWLGVERDLTFLQHFVSIFRTGSVRLDQEIIQDGPYTICCNIWQCCIQSRI